jgi:hypothetical protein
MRLQAGLGEAARSADAFDVLPRWPLSALSA